MIDAAVHSIAQGSSFQPLDSHSSVASSPPLRLRYSPLCRPCRGNRLSTLSLGYTASISSSNTIHPSFVAPGTIGPPPSWASGRNLACLRLRPSSSPPTSLPWRRKHHYYAPSQSRRLDRVKFRAPSTSGSRTITARARHASQHPVALGRLAYPQSPPGWIPGSWLDRELHVKVSGSWLGFLQPVLLPRIHHIPLMRHLLHRVQPGPFFLLSCGSIIDTMICPSTALTALRPNSLTSITTTPCGTRPSTSSGPSPHQLYLHPLGPLQGAPHPFPSQNHQLFLALCDEANGHNTTLRIDPRQLRLRPGLRGTRANCGFFTSTNRRYIVDMTVSNPAAPTYFPQPVLEPHGVPICANAGFFWVQQIRTADKQAWYPDHGGSKLILPHAYMLLHTSS